MRGRAAMHRSSAGPSELDRLLAVWEGVAGAGQARARDAPRRPRHRQEPALARSSRTARPATPRCSGAGASPTARASRTGRSRRCSKAPPASSRATIPKPCRRRSPRCSTSLGTDDPDQLRTIAAALANLVGDRGGAPTPSPAAEISQAELHWGIRRVLELLAAKRPLMLVFEDLHWAEPTLFELIEFIGEADAPILVFGSARRELRELRPDFCTDTDRRTTISLSALGEEESEALLAELLGARELPAGSRAGAAAARTPAGTRSSSRRPSACSTTRASLDGEGDLDDVAVPTSLQAMIGSRLDSLPAADKRVAHHASVVGMVFWSGAVVGAARRGRRGRPQPRGARGARVRARQRRVEPRRRARMGVQARA